MNRLAFPRTSAITPRDRRRLPRRSASRATTRPRPARPYAAPPTRATWCPVPAAPPRRRVCQAHISRTQVNRLASPRTSAITPRDRRRLRRRSASPATTPPRPDRPYAAPPVRAMWCLTPVASARRRVCPAHISRIPARRCATTRCPGTGPRKRRQQPDALSRWTASGRVGGGFVQAGGRGAFRGRPGSGRPDGMRAWLLRGGIGPVRLHACEPRPRRQRHGRHEPDRVHRGHVRRRDRTVGVHAGECRLRRSGRWWHTKRHAPRKRSHRVPAIALARAAPRVPSARRAALAARPCQRSSGPQSPDAR